MDFLDEFDVIFFNAALRWILNHSLLLNHSFRALKQGGSIHWNFAGDGTCAAFYYVVRMKMRDKQYAPHFNGFIWPWFMPSKEQYKALIESVGFSKIGVVEENKDRYFPDTDEMTRWINQPSIVPFIKCIPDNMKESFRREVIQLMVEKTKQKDVTCFETFRRINVTAIKYIPVCRAKLQTIPGIKIYKYSVILSLRGIGNTKANWDFDKKEVVPEGYTIKDMADDLAFAMEQLNLCSADVFGVSQGGMIAQYLAIYYPQLIHKYVLGVTALRQNKVIENVINGWICMAERGNYEAVVIDMLPKMYSDAYVKKYGWMFPILSKMGKLKDLSRFIALAEACLTCDAYPHLEKITCSVFVIGGKQDHIVTGIRYNKLRKFK